MPVESEARERTILVVDDEPIVQRVLESALCQFSYNTVAATGGDEALDILCAGQPQIDLVLSDVQMPAGDGIALLQNIKDRWPKLPVILLTGFGSLDQCVQAMELGAFKYLAKPPDLMQLRRVVRRALSQNTEQASNVQD